MDKRRDEASLQANLPSAVDSHRNPHAVFINQQPPLPQRTSSQSNDFSRSATSEAISSRKESVRSTSTNRSNGATYLYRSSLENETVSLLSTENYTSSLFTPSRENTQSSSFRDERRVQRTQSELTSPVPPVPSVAMNFGEPRTRSGQDIPVQDNALRETQSSLTSLDSDIPTGGFLAAPVRPVGSRFREIGLDSNSPRSSIRRSQHQQARGDYSAIIPDSTPLPTIGSTKKSQFFRRRSRRHRNLPSDANGSAFGRFLTLLPVYLALFLSAAAVGQVIPTARRLTSAFDSTASPLWLLLSYTVPLGAFLLPVARLLAFIPRRFVLGFGALVLCVGSVLAGITDHVASRGGRVAFLCFCRGLQGIGASGVISASYAICTSLDQLRPSKGMGRYLWGLAMALGMSVGAIIAVVLAQNEFSWQWAFYSLAAWSGVVSIAGVFGEDDSEPEGQETSTNDNRSILSPWNRFDVVGASFFLSGTLLFGTGWGELANEKSTRIVGYILVGIGALLLGGFGLVEMRAANPLLPKKRTIKAEQALNLGHSSATFSAYAVWLWYLVQWVVDVRGGSLYLPGGFLAAQGGVIVLTICILCLLSDRGSMWIKPAGNALLLISCTILPFTSKEGINWPAVAVGVAFAPVGLALSMNKGLELPLDLGYEERVEYQCFSWSMTLVVLSTSLGVAGAVQSFVRNDESSPGYPVALYFACGLGAFGLGIALVWPARSYIRKQ